jgi:hypothetical protein
MTLWQPLSMSTLITSNPGTYINNTKRSIIILPTHMKGKLEEMKKNIQLSVLKK